MNKLEKKELKELKELIERLHIETNNDMIGALYELRESIYQLPDKDKDGCTNNNITREEIEEIKNDLEFLTFRFNYKLQKEADVAFKKSTKRRWWNNIDSPKIVFFTTVVMLFLLGVLASLTILLK